MLTSFTKGNTFVVFSLVIFLFACKKESSSPQSEFQNLQGEFPNWTITTSKNLGELTYKDIDAARSLLKTASASKTDLKIETIADASNIHVNDYTSGMSYVWVTRAANQNITIICSAMIRYNSDGAKLLNIITGISAVSSQPATTQTVVGIPPENATVTSTWTPGLCTGNFTAPQAFGQWTGLLTTVYHLAAAGSHGEITTTHSETEDITNSIGASALPYYITRP